MRAQGEMEEVYARNRTKDKQLHIYEKHDQNLYNNNSTSEVTDYQLVNLAFLTLNISPAL